MFKRFLKSRQAAKMAASLIGAYVRLVEKTSRLTIIDREHFDLAAAQNKGVILAFWHGRLMMAPAIREETDKRVFMLISAHRDGEIIADAVKSFGIDFIRGSSANPKKPEKNKGGASAIAQMLAALEEGHVVGVTPDGPRGPGEKVQLGVVRLAQMSGAPIVPAAISISRGPQLGTWDRFLVGAPFSRVIYKAGPAIAAPDENDPAAVESVRKKLENALAMLTAEADALAGRNKTKSDNGALTP